MAELVYVLCALTSLACTVLLFRSYRQTRARLLLWSACCFLGLTVNNVLLFVDLIVVPEVQLGVLRSSVALVAIALLLYGLIKED